MDRKTTRVVLIEDDPDDIFLIQKLLNEDRDPRHHYVVEGAKCIEEGLPLLLGEKTDALLLDLFLPDGNGLHTLYKIHQVASNIPIIIVTNLDAEQPAIDALNHGAQDYVIKRGLTGKYLQRTIQHAIERHRVQNALNEANLKLNLLATMDPLTELLNRRGLQEVLTKIIKQTSKTEIPMASLLVDLDDFKPVNDMFGHAVGDVVLYELAQRLKSSIRLTDAVARVGGDEFMILLPNTTLNEATHVAEKVRFGISGSPVILSSGKPVKITASLGLANIPNEVASVDELLCLSYNALKKSKVSGKNRVTCNDKGFQDADQPMSDTTAILANLRVMNSYQSVKQSIVRLSDLNLVGYEFLSRSTIEGLEMPDDFFRFSMEKNVLPSADHACFRAAILSSALVNRPGIRCHVNLFPSTLIDIPIQQLIDEFPACRTENSYCVEISEQQIIGTPSNLLEQVKSLKKAGILVAIDDIGFGRTYLESLIDLEPNIVKIDKSCVKGIFRDAVKLKSLKRILDVARVLNAEVIAEGIESKEDLNVLKDIGVLYGQGFLIHYPA